MEAASTALSDGQANAEMARIRDQITALTAHRDLLRTTLLSSHRTLTRLRRANAATTTNAKSNPRLSTALRLAESHHRANTRTLYRSLAGATTFVVQDPDPHAPDGGRVLGVRIDVCGAASPASRHGGSEGEMATGAISSGDGAQGGAGTRTPGLATPHYLLFRRTTSNPTSSALTLHKHTLPPSIPLAALLRKYLPQPSAIDTAKPAPPQDLARLVAALRHTLAAQQLRLAALSALAADARGAGAGMGVERVEYDASGSGRDVRLRWTGGGTGVLKLAAHGTVEGVVVYSTSTSSGTGSGPGGADSLARARKRRDIERALLGARVDDLGARLRAVARMTGSV
ncbi:hypothetical protein B0A49_05837 [Cryomyces minteri]|uniref:Uncharacterized protein n=1 Tax=Cryomyces minteri TaxID=331657 RepID=A0A4U0XIB8_9PEZI|nr:hypothetical protein B0A49_05837 [Cryomyces minteri]